MQKLSF